MDKILSLKIPGRDGISQEIVAPEGVPTGGLDGGGGQLLGLGITWLLIASVILALGFLLYGGFNWIMSRGEKEKLESARKTIIFSVLGLAFVFLSLFVINLIGGLLGVNFLVLSL